MDVLAAHKWRARPGLQAGLCAVGAASGAGPKGLPLRLAGGTPARRCGRKAAGRRPPRRMLPLRGSMRVAP